MESASNKPDTEQASVVEASDAPKKKDYTMAMLCHLLALTALIGVPFGNILGPLVIWLIKKEQDPFVDKCGKESLNFQITALLAGAALGLFALFSMMIAMIPLIGMISFLFLPLIALLGIALIVAVIVYTVIASIKTSEGTHYRYPYNLRLIK